MKKNRMTFLVALILISLGGLSGLQAQETVATTGGDATGNGGSVSYTVGQVFYSSQIGTGGSTVMQGVQQPYEISIETGIPEANGISLRVSVYPNPTTDHLTIRVKDYKSNDLKFILIDMNGKILQIKNAEGDETQINMQNLIPANYFVKIVDGDKEIKVFKVIKTQ